MKFFKLGDLSISSGVKIFQIALFLLTTLYASTQPQKIHYQAIAIGNNGLPIRNATVVLRLSIIDSIPNGRILFSEIQTTNTDISGQMSFNIGAGSPSFGAFSSIIWGNGNDKFLKLEMDSQGINNFIPLGIIQLVSVPYSFVSGGLTLGAKIYDTNGTEFSLLILNNEPEWFQTSGPYGVKMNYPCKNLKKVFHEGQWYTTVQIGNQCWFKENINSGQFSTANQQLNNSIPEKFCYQNDSNFCKTYGGLYQWAEAMNYQNNSSNFGSSNLGLNEHIRGICPSGWHIPSSYEWCKLIDFLENNVDCNRFGAIGNSSGGKLKSQNILWSSPNSGASNLSGFQGLPSGFRDISGLFGSLGYYSTFWSCSDSQNTSITYNLNYDQSAIIRGNAYKMNSFSVRCLKDTTCSPTKATAGSDQLNIFGNVAVLNGNFPTTSESGNWSIIHGNGGNFSVQNQPNSTFIKGTDSIYTLVWSISSGCGITKDTISLHFKDPNTFNCGALLSYAGELYPTVSINNQCWIAKNLNCGITLSTTIKQKNNQVVEKYCYNNDPNSCQVFGGIYQWAEAIQYLNGSSDSTSPNPSFSGNVQGICPQGWHIPSDNEMCSLIQSIDPNSNCQKGIVSYIAGDQLKSNQSWNRPSPSPSSFAILAGGYMSFNGGFDHQGEYTSFWTSSNFSSHRAWNRSFYDRSGEVTKNHNPKSKGLYIRCIKN